MTYNITLTFNSDWHIGTGAGIPGSVDRQVLRDADGLPFVPGKTLTGIIRDAAEWIAATRDVAKAGSDWNKVLIELFGEQPETHGGTPDVLAKSAKIGISSAVLNDDTKSYLIANRHLIPELFIIQPGVKMDPFTGRSLPDHLFTIEKARKGCKLQAAITVLDDKVLELNEKKLLEDALKAVRRIGGKRRRGGGACTLEFKLQDTAKEQSKANTAQNTDVTLASNLSEQKESFVQLEFKLTTKKPVIINRETLGNMVVTEEYIPGSYLLPQFANKIFSSPDLKADVQKAIQNGTLSIGNFLPEMDTCSTLPVPLCFMQEKASKAIINGLVAKADAAIQTKDLRSGYITLHAKNKIVYHTDAVKTITRVHNTVDDFTQRPSSNVGGLFTYEAIDAGQSFYGSVRIEAGLWQKLSKAAEISDKLKYSVFSIGQSQKDEYGAVELTQIKPSVSIADNCLDAINGNDGSKYLVLYLVSDLLLRGASLSYSSSIEDIKTRLESELGIALEHSHSNCLGGERSTCIRTGRRESWHRSWVLPRPSILYFQAGSVLVFKLKEPENWNKINLKLKSLVEKGLGDRCAEGYGRFMINPDFLCNNSWTLDNATEASTLKQTKQSSPKNATIIEQDFIKLLKTENVKNKFKKAARHLSYTIVEGRKNSGKVFNLCENAGISNIDWNEAPSPSQFGIVRELAAAITGSDCSVLQTWVKHAIKKQEGSITEKKSWRKKWLDWIDKLSQNPELVWKLDESLKKIEVDHGADFTTKEKTVLNASALSIFLDIFCEAIFDDELNKKKSSKTDREAE